MEIFGRIVGLLCRKESFALVTILSRSGPAPRSAGTRMIVLPDGQIIGSVGGGSLEAEAEKMAREVISTRGALLREFVLTPEETDGVGMICGGHVELLAHFVDASDETLLPLYRSITAAPGEQSGVWLITRIPCKGESGPTQCLVSRESWISGSLRLEGLEFDALIDRVGCRKGTALIVREGERFLIERLRGVGTVYIFGAGHVGHSVAPLARMMGFRVVVVDDREEFASRERFEKADEIIVLDSFEHPLRGIDINLDSYIVIVTRGHAFDGIVLESALKTEAGYIGMIGSRKKRDAIYGAILAKGYTAWDLERVHSPIGLEIGAETPEEIALSIVGELVKARAEKNHAAC